MRSIAAKGVKIAAGDTGDPASLEQAMCGIWPTDREPDRPGFLVQVPVTTRPPGIKHELTGKERCATLAFWSSRSSDTTPAQVTCGYAINEHSPESGAR